MIETNTQILERLYRDIWNGERPETAEEFVADDYVIHDREIADHIRGPALYEQLTNTTREIFPDMTFTIEDLFTTDDRVAVRWAMTGTHEGELYGIPGTGKVVELKAIEINRFEDGKLAETWTQSDQLGLMEQAGALSEAE